MNEHDDRDVPETDDDVAKRTPPEPVLDTTTTDAGIGGPVGRGGIGTGTGYIGGPQDVAGGPAGMRQLIGDELRERRESGEAGETETDANVSQRDH